MNDKYLVFHVEGGLGKNVASTSLLKPLSEKYKDRKIVVVASYPEVFLNNPDIYRVYGLGRTSYFYDDYIKNKDTIVLRREPYFENNHVMRKTTLMETWFSMYGLNYKEGIHKPFLPMNMIQYSTQNAWIREKPIFILHTNGGPFFKDAQPHGYSWTRDMPPAVATEITQRAIKKGYDVVQVCRENSFVMQGAEVVSQKLTAFELFSLLLVSKKRLLIDSCLQHAAVAYNLPSTVLWVGTSPKMFGYKVHTNIEANPPKGHTKLVDSYIFDYDFNGHPHECPYMNDTEMFDIDRISKSLQL